ncbi:hypothetical protein ARAM_000775 [Aspergillus rambellii]|uniref:Mid2 domain-containing protein n=3 Tax=Aspergillus subgen. Nidulantes TaxID=2720870 RepID=A0A0F8U3J7_9EURO|nr:hypothetical protein AOCH_003262 [Aspergillus ochraceoroseus]KKK14309.1 hypothetical protein ARAM_000775 [Aspergillus rambellii]
MFSRESYLLCWLSFLWTVEAFSTGYVPVQTRNNADPDTVVAIKRALHAARDTTYSMNRTSIEKSWADATLFSLELSTSSTESKNATLDLHEGISVICTTCYVNGSIGGSLRLGGDFNLTETVDSFTDEVTNVTDSAFDQIEEYLEDVFTNITLLHFDEIPAWPTVDIDFDFEHLDGFPEVQAQFEFDGLELYLELDVQLSAGATYTLNLFTSETIAGFSVPNLEAGAVFKVSLVLIAEAEIDISSGIHIKLDDGLKLDLELFNKNVSGITLPGGRVEFLPITIEGQGSLQALLQLEASLGFEVSAQDLAPEISFSAGIAGEAFAYVADFLVQVNSSTSDDADCKLAAAAEYTLAVGAAAGATVAVNTYQWGPAPSTTIPIWYTTVASLCAGSKTASSAVTSQATLDRRDWSTTAVSTSSTYTIVGCISAGLVHCPASLQTTTSIEKTMTTILSVPSGAEDVTYPASTFASVTSAIPFGEHAHTLSATSGTPTSYVPPPVATQTSTNTTDSGGLDDDGDDDDDNHSNDNKLIIGLSVGLGVPILIVLAAGLG